MEEERQGLAGHPGQHARLALDDHRLRPERARGRRRLQPDVTAADHRQPLTGAECGLQPIRIGGGAKLEHSVQLQARQGNSPRPRARGEDQGVVRQHLAVLEHHRLCSALDAVSAHAEMQLDVGLGVKAFGP